LLILLGSASAQSAHSSVQEEEKLPAGICATALHWVDMKPPMDAGAKMAVVEGDPKGSGHFTIRVWFPPYYKIPPHIHPVDERTTVLSGEVNVGYGDTMDTTRAKKYAAGCFYFNPAGMHHYVFTTGAETVIQVSTNGPWGLHILEPGELEKQEKK